MELRKIVVKLNIGFSGEGNAMLYTDKFDKNNLKESIKKSLREDLKFVYQLETWDSF